MKVKNVSEIKQLGTILGIWAHPDDESFCCAGIMAAAIDNGQRVVCITATKGEKGVQDVKRWPPEKLAQIRTKEMAEGLSILGVNEHHWLGYPDGKCSQVSANQAIIRIAAFIRQIKPDTILTFGPEGMTGHPDHRTVSKWVDKAVKLAESRATIYHAVDLPETYEAMREADKKFNFFFNIDKPPIVEARKCNIVLHLPKDLLNKKFNCLCAMPSQTEAMFKYFGYKAVCKMIASEAFIEARSVDP